MKQRFDTKELVLTGMLTAIVFVATYAIQLRTSNTGGLVHAGNIALFSIALVYGKYRAAISGAVGMSLFDLLSGQEWAIWAPGTFVVRLITGFVVGYIAFLHHKEGKSIIYNSIAMIAGTAVIVVGYFIFEGILYGDWTAPFLSIPGNITQSVIGMIGALLLAPKLWIIKEHSEPKGQ